MSLQITPSRLTLKSSLGKGDRMGSFTRDRMGYEGGKDNYFICSVKKAGTFTQIALQQFGSALYLRFLQKDCKKN